VWQSVGQKMIAIENKLVEGIERRGRVYYMRMRVPAAYSSIERRKEVNKSLKTRDFDEAKANFAVAKRAMLADWKLQLEENRNGFSSEPYDAAVEMLQSIGVSFKPQNQLLDGPIEELLERIEAISTDDLSSAKIPAMLGAFDYPKIPISKMPEIIEQLNARQLRSKNDRQMREWRNKYKHVAKWFCKIVGDKPVMEITELDARKYFKYWQEKRDAGKISTDFAKKRIRFIKQLVEAYFERFDVPSDLQKNFFASLKLKRLGQTEEPAKKLPLPPSWIKTRLIDQIGMEDLEQQARDIATLVGEAGGRQSEIADLPPDAIHLDHEIPHIMIAVETDGEFRREIKNVVSKRPMVLLGAALDAMKRNPTGFDKYRGKAGYSGKVNKYLRDNNLFPPTPDGETSNYTLSGTRHTFEDRMKHVGMDNEERAYLMGHSIGALRGRPVYGSSPDLKLRSLYQEMVSFPTNEWTPRPVEEIRKEIEQLAIEQGFRVK